MDNVTSILQTRKPKPVRPKLHYQCISSAIYSNKALSKFLTLGLLFSKTDYSVELL